MKSGTRTLLLLFLQFASPALLFAQAPAQPPQQPEFVKQGQQLIRGGKPYGALALYCKALQTEPDSLPANIAAGTVLDLMGKGEEARKILLQSNRGRRHAGAQSRSAKSNGDVLRFRGKLRQNNRVRTASL
jgi:hypothetical protein